MVGDQILDGAPNWSRHNIGDAATQDHSFHCFGIRTISLDPPTHCLLRLSSGDSWRIVRAKIVGYFSNGDRSMTDEKEWRVAHLGGNNKSYHDFVFAFEQAYEANGRPDNMAMFSHVDSLGILMAVSITPESVAHCPFSNDWSASNKPPLDFGNVGWVAGDRAPKITAP